MADLRRDGDVFVLDLGGDENRLNPDCVASFDAALDEVEAAPAPRALVTMATGKFWSTGLDLDWMGANGDGANAFVGDVQELLARVLGLGVPSVAAVQGHCFAAGAMLALAHDQRVMREDRGWFCLPEVDIRIPFTPGMSALISARLTKRAAHEAMTTGRRYGGGEAAQAWIVDAAVSEERVVGEAVERAAGLAGKDPATLARIKQTLYAEALNALREPVAFG
jgi:enoyl-CoA hydratase/carnithine racemase